MLFWYLGPDKPGHVATYIGSGRIVSNVNNDWTGHKPKVIELPAQQMVDAYKYKGHSGYVGWLMPPPAWIK